MRLMQSKVSAAVLAPDYGKKMSPGTVVDLDECLPGGGVLADVVNAAWFESIAPAVEPRVEAVVIVGPDAVSVSETMATHPAFGRMRTPRGSSTPVTPAHEETDNG